ncbi:hypothetical protein FAUST_4611 [Fusarium austroamericanum]|uniref:Regulatory protein n=1 Tax=Fusarium austroamericanum TaxID=282268 RepID=A0AAN6HGL3_FUSAU|nr:hypothetical protein FAUST_4611 [Fusarium austroamericanum]
MTRLFKAQVRQGKERQRDRDYVQVQIMGDGTKMLSTRWPDAATTNSELDTRKNSTAPYNTVPDSEHHINLDWPLNQIPDPKTFKEFDVDFTMLYVDHVFPFLFPFYAPPMIQGGRAWVLDVLHSNQTLFQAVMSLSTFFLTLILSSEDVSSYEVCRQNSWNRLEVYTNSAVKALRRDVLAMNQQHSETNMLQRVRTMESITQLMVLEKAMARTAELHMHLAAAISVFEDVLELSSLDGSIDLGRVMGHLERPAWAPRTTQGPVWNTEQAALRFFFAILLQADVISCTTLQTVPRLRKYYPNLICHEYGDASTDTQSLLRMEEYMGCEGWALVNIAEIAALEFWKRGEQENGTFEAHHLTSRGDQIDRALQDSLRELEDRCTKREREPRRLLQKFYLSSDVNQRLRQATTTRIWAHAARVYLTLVKTGWQPYHPTIRQSVVEVLRLLRQQEDPAILCSSVWPFCVAGCVADASLEQEFRDLAASSGSLQSFGLVGESLRILERVWSRRGELSVDWNLAARFSIMGSPILLL